MALKRGTELRIQLNMEVLIVLEVILKANSAIQIPAQVWSKIILANLPIYNYFLIILVNCTWNSWSAWEICSVSCGNGTQERNRTKIPAQQGGADCVGNDTENQTCSTNPCPGNVIYAS